MFLETNNPLSLIKDVADNGYIRVEDSTSSLFKVQIKDFKNNLTELNISIEGRKPQTLYTLKDFSTNQTIIREGYTTVLEGLNSNVVIYPNSVYEDTAISFDYNGDTLKVHKDVIPFKKSFRIRFFK